MDDKRRLIEIVEDTPVIMAVKDWEGIWKCIEQEAKVVFILFGDICNIGEIIKTVKDAGKIAMVHMDLISLEIRKFLWILFKRLQMRTGLFLPNRL